MMQAKTIYLKDYRPSSFTIDAISLFVEIWPENTIVTSELMIKRRDGASNAPENLELNGESMKLLSIKLNGKDLESSRYQLSNEKLLVLGMNQDQFVLTIKNEINPWTNKACEGFYQSGEQLCTQCEPEGFRKITYFIDRPDVMCKFKTRMEGDKQRFPFLLSNGNRVNQGDLPNGRHFVEWVDPFRKPSYLFAMVAGDFDVARDSFITMSGRTVDLEIYVDKGNINKTTHAMESLKMAMKWDEETYGLEYDLDLYMIVAVDSFNMGAMENKGLNIFNSTYTLANQATATDHDFQNIQGVIGHEYFHNWTGNRVTCRDWFQLTLKEGLTVYRDQEFSSDMLSRAVKRIEDAKALKETQFPEDAGPLSHPIRPESYIEINNFYTRTVYEKGAEVIRMIETLIGKDKFRQGMEKYFELFDGQAVTTEDFVKAMELASGKDLSQFKNWYSRAGTPTLKVSSEITPDGITLSLEQQYPMTAHEVSDENVLHFPFRVGVVNETGDLANITLEIKKLKETFNLPYQPGSVLSLNRGFSSPVNVHYEYQLEDLLFLMAHDQDFYGRYEATQKAYELLIQQDLSTYHSTKTLNNELNPMLKNAIGRILDDQKIDLSFKSYLLEIPSLASLSQEMDKPDFSSLDLIRKSFVKRIGQSYYSKFLEIYLKLDLRKTFDLTTQGYARRAMKTQCLSYLVASGNEESLAVLNKCYSEANNMTEELHALGLYIDLGVDFEHPAIQGFFQKWKHDSLVMLKWFGAIAAYSPAQDVLSRIKLIEANPYFNKSIPNHLRSLYVQYSRGNLVSFHTENGEGYRFLSNRIAEIDKYNPQVAARICGAFSLLNRLDILRKKHMKESLEFLRSQQLSRDTSELVGKYLS